MGAYTKTVRTPLQKNYDKMHFGEDLLAASEEILVKRHAIEVKRQAME